MIAVFDEQNKRIKRKYGLCLIETIIAKKKRKISSILEHLRGRDGGAEVCSRIRNSISSDWMSL
jgi:hypothetical protein